MNFDIKSYKERIRELEQKIQNMDESLVENTIPLTQQENIDVTDHTQILQIQKNIKNAEKEIKFKKIHKPPSKPSKKPKDSFEQAQKKLHGI